MGGGAYIINPLAIHPSVACLLAVQLPIGSREGDNARWKGSATAMTLLALFDRLESLQMKGEVLDVGAHLHKWQWEGVLTFLLEWCPSADTEER